MLERVYQGERILFAFRWAFIFIGSYFVFKHYKTYTLSFPLIAALLVCAFYNSIFILLPLKILTKQVTLLLVRILDTLVITTFVFITSPITSDTFLLYFLVLIVAMRQLPSSHSLILAIIILICYWTPTLITLNFWSIKEVSKGMALRSLYLFLGYVVARLIEEPYFTMSRKDTTNKKDAMNKAGSTPLSDSAPLTTDNGILLLEKLSPREKEVLILFSKGKGTKEIATALILSESTVKTHISNIQNKLMIQDRIQLALFASRHQKNLETKED